MIKVSQFAFRGFINANMELIDACFSRQLRHDHRLDQTPQAVKLVGIARKELGYDDGDADIDIFMSIVHVWLDIKKQHATRRNHRSDVRMAAQPEPENPYGEKEGE